MTEAIATPASCKRRRTVAVLGGGIAGLTAAHELAERGFDVTVYEPRADERHGLDDEPGGTYPPVKLGGLAASQYSTVGPYTGSLAELRPTQAGVAHATPGGRLRVSTASASSPPAHTHLGPVPTNPGLPAHKQAHGEVAGTRPLHDHGQRQAVATQAPRLKASRLVFPAKRSHTRRIPHHRNSTHAIGLHRVDVQTFVSRLRNTW
jgi:choline dehydrogenase-like flavoprotein